MESADRKKFGEYIKRLRQEAGLSLREVERGAGISNSHLFQVEAGERNPPKSDVLAKLAELYRVSWEAMAAAAQIGQPPTSDERNLEMLIDNAFEFVRRDPDYAFGTQMIGDELSTSAKRFIVEVYEKATGSKLLGTVNARRQGTTDKDA